MESWIPSEASSYYSVTMDASIRGAIARHGMPALDPALSGGGVQGGAGWTLRNALLHNGIQKVKGSIPFWST